MTPITALLATLNRRNPEPCPPPPAWHAGLYWLGVIVGAVGTWGWSR